jgi:dienelactone hydrolase
MNSAAGVICAIVGVMAITARAVDPVLRMDPATPPAELVLHDGARIASQGDARCIELTSANQYATVPIARQLNGVKSATVTVWVYPRRSGEQDFVARGEVTIDEMGNRILRPEKTYVNFLLGTDRHGFLCGALHGNGRMPFAFVTLNELPINAWSFVAVTKDKAGYQRFYVNGVLVASDLQSAYAPVVREFAEMVDGPPIRLQMAQGGLMGECAVYGTALSDEQVKEAFEAGRTTYRPTLAARPVLLRAMDRHFDPELWGGEMTADAWRQRRGQIMTNLPKVLGESPADVVAYHAKRDGGRADASDLDAKVLSEEQADTYTRRKVRLRVQDGDLMYAWLLVPKRPLASRAPAVICAYGTTSGAGKDTTVGRSGPKPGSPVEKNRSFAIDFVEAGFVVLAPDFLRDGERVAPGDRPYDTTRFYKQFPEWSIHGKDAYDVSRAVDYLRSLTFVDPEKIAMTGHSYGGHTTIFATALEPRIKAAAASGPVSDLVHHGMHWAVPRGGGNSQSMPALRPYLLERFPHLAPTGEAPVVEGTPRALPMTFYEFTAMIAPRPLLVFQAVGERRPMEEENAAAVTQVYTALGAADRVKYLWHPGDHDYPPQARAMAIEWFKRHLQ